MNVKILIIINGKLTFKSATEINYILWKDQYQ